MNNLAIRKNNILSSVKSLVDGKIISTEKIVEVLENIIKTSDRVILEGNNQKQALFLAKSLCKLNPKKISNLKMAISSISEPEHLDIFELGIASTIDFAFAGGQSLRIAEMIEAGTVKVSSINTYLELYSRLLVDLIPNICLVAAEKADKHGNLYTGYNTEETPTLVECCAFKNGIVIVQVDEIVDKLPRVDIPGDWVDFVVKADEPCKIKPIFTRDPKKIRDVQVLMAMMVIKGVYAKHKVKSLNHGIGYNTAAIELLLPTYGESLGLKGKICNNWILNPHPTMIPAVEAGWIDNVYCFGSELGMQEFIKDHSDIFFTGHDGTLRSNRTFAQLAGLYAADLFIGSTLQMDYYGNSSTVTSGRLSGFGGAPNMGHNPNGRRHSSTAWAELANENDPLKRGKKLIVQVFETRTRNKESVFVEKLDAIDIAEKSGLPLPPVMIYAEDVTHVVTEQGIAYLYLCKTPEDRKRALAAVAGDTPLGTSITEEERLALRKSGVVAFPEDLEIDRTIANRNLLAAKNIDDLVESSKGLYNPPAEFRK